MESQLTSLGALDALAWQIELGADEALLDAPINRYELEQGGKAPEPKAQQPARVAPPPPAAAQSDAAALAQQAAEAASDLEGLHAAMASFPHSPLRDAARNCVFADGQPGARVMIVGEAPGRDEDARGLPFVGRAGQLLDKMLAAIGLSRQNPDLQQALYISNVLPFRPPQNRTPSPDEIALFLPFLKRHIALADPDMIVVMGNVPAQALLGKAGITRLRGTWAEAEGRPCLPMFHPAYLLRNPAAKRDAWADLLSLKARLRGGS